MAVNDRLDGGLVFSPPSSNAAALEARVGNSTDNENFWVWAFDASSAEKLDAMGAMSARYAGANLKVRFGWMSASATTGGVRWAAGFRRRDTGEDIDTTAHTYSEQAVTTATLDASGKTAYSEITFTQAQADNIAAGDGFVLRLRRDVAHAGDDMVGDAQLCPETAMVVET